MCVCEWHRRKFEEVGREGAITVIGYYLRSEIIFTPLVTPDNQGMSTNERSILLRSVGIYIYSIKKQFFFYRWQFFRFDFLFKKNVIYAPS